MTLPHHLRLSGLAGVVDGSKRSMEGLRSVALTRPMLDNFSHIKAFWVMITPRVAQIALCHGADDMDGTVTAEEIVRAAGADTSRGLTRNQLGTLIRETGRDSMERDTLCRPLTQRTTPVASPASTAS